MSVRFMFGIAPITDSKIRVPFFCSALHSETKKIAISSCFSNVFGWATTCTLIVSPGGTLPVEDVILNIPACRVVGFAGLKWQM